MTKQPKEFEKLPSFGSSFGTSGKWKENWKKLESENKKLLAQYMKDSSISPLPWLDMTLFNEKVIADIFSQTMKSLSEQAESKNEVHAPQVVNIQDFLHSTLKKFGKESVKTPLKSQRRKHQTAEWDENPFFYLLHQSYLLNEQFLKDAVSRIGELDPLISHKLASYTRHLADSLSLSHHPLSNVEDLHGALALTVSTPKINPAASKTQENVPQDSTNRFELGSNIGSTPGKIVFQNDLFQLIQYEPLTEVVAKQPVLIVPPWINKYYIFDLSLQNSFVRWAVKSGLTVFVMSWAHSQEEYNHVTLTDYVLGGVKSALDQVCQLTSVKKVNVLGYCLGGTLVACLLGYLQAKKDGRIASATFMATPFDFSRIDELGIYRCERQQRHLEKYVATNGYLEGQYMVQAFNLLRVNDLIWASDVNHYLLGQESFPFDMLYWVCDALRMPAKMHSTYLRDILIENQLMKPGRLSIEGTPIKLQNIKTPLFVMAAMEDHVAPWMSVYALTQMTKSVSQQFLLSSSGHLKGVFNPPGLQKDRYWKSDSLPIEADEWLTSAKEYNGSWWSEWRRWLEDYEGEQVPARAISENRIIEDAPGSYAMTTKDSQMS
jgi:polyhydroxyalkanoate synthase